MMEVWKKMRWGMIEGEKREIGEVGLEGWKGGGRGGRY